MDFSLNLPGNRRLMVLGCVGTRQMTGPRWRFTRYPSDGYLTPGWALGVRFFRFVLQIDYANFSGRLGVA